MRLLLYFFTCLLSIGPCSLQAQQKQAGIRFEALDRLLMERDENAPGVVVAISQHGKLVYEKAVGLANLEHQAPLRTTSVFEAGSVSKQFTATAVLQLAGDGKLSLEDDVRKYVPELPDYGQTITIRHLLTMTSGLRDWRNITYLTGMPTFERLYNQDEALRIICAQQALNFSPGEQYAYSNSNYDLLSIIVSRVSGREFEDYATQAVLDPVGFKYSRWRGDHLQVVSDKAQAYNKVKGRYVMSQPVENTHGAAGMLVTAGDLLRWSDFWANGGFGKELGAWRLARGKLNNGDTIAYACGGIRVNTYRGEREIEHGGLVGGYRAWLASYPEAGISIACLSNDRSFVPSRLQEKVREILDRGVKPEPRVAYRLGDERLREIAGIYKDTKGYNTITIEAKDTILTIRDDTLKPIAADTFLLENTRYIINGSGDIVRPTSAQPVIYRRVKACSPTTRDMKALEGIYDSDELNLSFELKVEEGKLRAYRHSYDVMVLKPAYQDGKKQGYYALSNGLRTLFEFTTNAKGSKDLVISVPRAEHFVFRKL